MTSAHKVFFIVGNSRSGTTMMLRMLGNHPMICGLNELHFFEHLWSPEDRDRTIASDEALKLAGKLLYIQRDGFIGRSDPDKYRAEATHIIDRLETEAIHPHEVYLAMMRYETDREGRSIPCEKTPQNVFYLSEIFDLIPEARVVNMIRDPRAVMLSQKRKWRRRKMGADFITPWEVIRLRINYHPITLSRLWNAAIRAGRNFRDDERVLDVRFEDILDNPPAAAQRICAHLGIPYDPSVLDIPLASSSNEADSGERGIKKKRAGNWKKGGLSAAEIWWCERISGELMCDTGYEMEDNRPNPLMIAWYALTFPFKIVLALAVNLNRMKNVAATLKRRLR